MANTYTQINIQVVFSVEERACLLREDFRSRLFEYMAGILRQRGCYVLAVGGYWDHVHLFFEFPPKLSLSEIVRDVKRVSSEWINGQNFFPGRFRWQEGFGAFSYARSQRDAVIRYINRQEEHHMTQTFKEEYLDFLTKFEIPFEERYAFKWLSLPNENA